MEIYNNINSRVVFLSLLIAFCLELGFCLSIDTIFPGQYISGEQTLASAGDKFILGFFSPGNSQNRYLGIWFSKVEPRTVVWIANRENPVTDSAPGALKFSTDGNLVVLDGNQNRSNIWSTNSLVPATSAKLLDSGNMVLVDGSGRFLWQSFDYPTDTYIPGMKLGRNMKTGLNWSLTSWKSSDDPSPGKFTLEMVVRGIPQFYTMMGDTKYWSSGPWTGQGWSGVADLGLEAIHNYSMITNDDEIYYTESTYNVSILYRVVLDNSGAFQLSTWSQENRVWMPFWSQPRGPCQIYGACGPFGVCHADSFQRCKCLQGYDPKSQQEWDLKDWSGGCVRKTEVQCEEGDDFLRLSRVSLPDTSTLDQVDENLSLQDCKAKCWNNCSCTGYANYGVHGPGSGCAIWSGRLMNLQEFSDHKEEFYLRVASSGLGSGITNETSLSNGSSTKKRRTLAIAISVPLSGMLLLLVWCGCCMWRKKNSLDGEKGGEDEDGRKSSEFPLFKFSVIEAATNNFSDANKLGKGGFGPVYKGNLPNGQEIAVKRLSKGSGQGIVEFENEVVLTAKLQHRNLVRLLGYCTYGEEKLLIYEYMPNKSLDSFLFDQNKSKLLDWKMRFNIIVGIARGILYFHEDSRLRIIHRDLKSSNILLDAEMNPKISDFGIARSFGSNQTQANTRKVVGTFGYMSPEYAIRGVFSEKSDIFSFGVLVLEIVSGKNINDFCHLDDYLSLTGYGWQLWEEGRSLEFMDSSLNDSCLTTREVLRCIHIGLLCVQESPVDRPNMSSIVFMLGSETDLPSPKKPAFSTLSEADVLSSQPKSCSINVVTVTMLQAR